MAKSKNKPVTPRSSVPFGLHLHTCNLGNKVRIGENPFTGEKVEFPLDEGLTSAERAAVKAFLKECKASKPDSETYCKVKFSDGSYVNMAIGTLNDDDPCIAFAVECSDFTQPVVSFVFELAKRGKMSIGSTIGVEVVAFINAPSNLEKKRWPSAQVIQSVGDLTEWLRINVGQGLIV